MDLDDVDHFWSVHLPAIDEDAIVEFFPGTDSSLELSNMLGLAAHDGVGGDAVCLGHIALLLHARHFTAVRVQVGRNEMNDGAVRR